MEFERDVMDTSDKKPTESTGEESFAEMFEKSFKKQGRLEPGQMVEAMIVKISPEWVFLDLGGKGEGYLDPAETQSGERAHREDGGCRS